MAGSRGRLKALLLVVVVLPLGGCQLGYFGHLAAGQIEVLRARQPIEALLADSGTDPALRARLETVRAARAFAVEALALPDSGSFDSFVQLDRAYVLWNVFAAPELSLQPKQWCYPFQGCFAYRGYYDRRLAREEAERLAAAGFDTYVSGVPAYSTLGWFDDPLLWSMLYWDDATLIETVFHELAHERLYVADDTAFNESYATFVGREGLRQWRAVSDDAPPVEAAQRCRRADFVALVSETRANLEAVYAQDAPDAVKRAAKHAAIDDLRERYRRLRDTRWGGYDGYDAWFEEAINNAKLLPVGLYHRWVPAFGALFAETGDWTRFHERVEALAGRAPGARQRRLEALADGVDGARGGDARTPSTACQKGPLGQPAREAARNRGHASGLGSPPQARRPRGRGTLSAGAASAPALRSGMPRAATPRLPLPRAGARVARPWVPE